MIKLFLDDVRDTPEGWMRTYTASQTIKLLGEHTVTHLSLDHDLGEDPAVGTGYDVLLWLEEAVAVGRTPPQEITIHSSNAGARPRMLAAIESIRRLCAQQRLAVAPRLG